MIIGIYRILQDICLNYTTFASPLTNLTEKGQPTKLMWSEEADGAFKELKAMLCCSPFIKQPDFDRCFVLRIDASDKCIGAVLLQEYDGERFPVAYTRKKLNPTQAVYAILERECLGIVWALESLRPTYIGGHLLTKLTINH